MMVAQREKSNQSRTIYVKRCPVGILNKILMNTFPVSENRRQMMLLIKYKSLNTEFYILARLRGLGEALGLVHSEFHHPWPENQS